MGPPRKSQGHPSQSPRVSISKALSWLLRHGAASERMAMDASGYVKVNDVLNWRKMRALNAGFEELVQVVEENEKQRFGMRYDGNDEKPAGNEKQLGVEQATTAVMDDTGTSTSNNLNGVEGSSIENLTTGAQPSTPSTPQDQTIHQAALAKFHSEPSPSPGHYSIRAVQGHSIRTVDAAELHQPITLSNPSSIPAVCVHGTFRNLWPAILKTGGLKAMSRVQVHFASGPRPEDVLQTEDAKEGSRHLKDAMVKSQVRSGMRPDAELLIYVDVQRALEAGMEWWRSENGVILTEGIVVAEEEMEEEGGEEEEEGKDEKSSQPVQEISKREGDDDDDSRTKEEAHQSSSHTTPSDVNFNRSTPNTLTDKSKEIHKHKQKQKQKQRSKSKPTQKLVPITYWNSVIEVGIGLGVVWERDRGIVQEVPPGQSRKKGSASGRGSNVSQGKNLNSPASSMKKKKTSRSERPELNVERER